MVGTYWLTLIGSMWITSHRNLTKSVYLILFLSLRIIAGGGRKREQRFRITGKMTMSMTGRWVTVCHFRIREFRPPDNYLLKFNIVDTKRTFMNVVLMSFFVDFHGSVFFTKIVKAFQSLNKNSIIGTWRGHKYTYALNILFTCWVRKWMFVAV